MTVIKEIKEGTPAYKKIEAGETLVSINGHTIKDVLDYKYYSYEERLVVGLKTISGKDKIVAVKKSQGEDMGLEFETYLMDKSRSCANNCPFCFVDQLPKGMRDTLYFKDDDARLSFLTGNYITMTNLSPREVQRIIDLKVSPINISVHATEPELRCKLLGNNRAGDCLEIMKKFADGGITMNCQIVCCPGLNDGQALERTMEDLSRLYPQVSSVAIVPVGLTKYREGLYPLEPFDKDSARAVIDVVEHYADKSYCEKGRRVFYCSDEMYLRAQMSLPYNEYYGDYAQLENGVGMMRLLITEFMAALEAENYAIAIEPFSIATGTSAEPFIKKLAETAAEKYGSIEYKVYAIKNDFFGHTINVAGLITAGDIISQLKGKYLGERLLIPKNMLRSGENVFLDDLTTDDVSEALGVPVIAVEQDGGDLLDKIISIKN